MKTETSVVVEKYKDSIFSAAFNVCANAADAEDVVQDTFIRYHTTNTQFADEQHIRAWLLRVAINNAIGVSGSGVTFGSSFVHEVKVRAVNNAAQYIIFFIFPIFVIKVYLCFLLLSVLAFFKRKYRYDP